MQHSYILRAVTPAIFLEEGGWLACSGWQSKFRAELGCDPLALTVYIKDDWKLLKGSSNSLELPGMCLTEKPGSQTPPVPIKPRLGRARWTPRELHPLKSRCRVRHLRAVGEEEGQGPAGQTWQW